jgi:hypothetical protein
MRAFKSVEAFYDADPRRRRSLEIDYGVMWRDGDKTWPTWKVSLCTDTGEIYAAAQSGPSNMTHTVYLLADGLTQDACEELLEGWEERCGHPKSFDWIMNTCLTYLSGRDGGL